MTTAEPAIEMSYADYLIYAQRAEMKQEFLRGRVYAMGGGTVAHSGIAHQLAYLLTASLEGKRCQVFQSDLRIRVRDTQLATYPDISVVCGPVEVLDDDPHGVVNPVVLVEVLSPSTAAHDRGAKAAHYRRIPSLREYVLIEPDRRQIEVQRRVENRWEIIDVDPEGQLELMSLGVSLSLDAIYRDPLADDEGYTTA